MPCEDQFQQSPLVTTTAVHNGRMEENQLSLIELLYASMYGVLIMHKHMMGRYIIMKKGDF